MMRGIKSKDTAPEMIVRRLVYSLGFRYRLHRKDLPGKPDLVFQSRKKIIFVHGCYWHQHLGCKAASIPKSNQKFWIPKLKKNAERDASQLKQLAAMGWGVLTVWECETKNTELLVKSIDEFLNETKGSG